MSVLIIAALTCLYMLGSMTLLLLFTEYSQNHRTPLNPKRATAVLLLWPFAILYAVIAGLIKWGRERRR